MASKQELQTKLKEEYQINKNISQSLSEQECYRLLQLLQDQPSVLHLTESFIEKNDELAQNNRKYGQQRSLAIQNRDRAVQLLESLQAENRQLEQSIDQTRRENQRLEDDKRLLAEQNRDLQRGNQGLEKYKQQLAKQKRDLQRGNQGLEEYKRQLAEQKRDLQREVSELTESNHHLRSTVSNLSSKNQELTTANAGLKQDNKELKNLVDQIRLRLAQDTKMLLQYEDSEIRKAMIRLFRWTLG